ncbi:hypothetical protein RKD29_002202 [Streptomyces tendae]
MPLPRQVDGPDERTGVVGVTAHDADLVPPPEDLDTTDFL